MRRSKQNVFYFDNNINLINVFNFDFDFCVVIVVILAAVVVVVEKGTSFVDI